MRPLQNYRGSPVHGGNIRRTKGAIARIVNPRTLILVRHCQAAGQEPDAVLTDTGIEQSRDLADFLRPLQNYRGSPVHGGNIRRTKGAIARIVNPRTLILVRHCQAAGQEPDAVLTDTGIEQSRDLADFLRPLQNYRGSPVHGGNIRRTKGAIARIVNPRTLILVRHCQAAGQEADAGLTDTGIEQSRDLAVFLRPLQNYRGSPVHGGNVRRTKGAVAG